jgi:hypothetical protein
MCHCRGPCDLAATAATSAKLPLFSTSELRSEPFLEEKKHRNSFPNHFRMRKNFRIPFRTNSPLQKTLKNSLQTICGGQKTLGKRRLLLAASGSFIIWRNFIPFSFVPRYVMESSEILRITWNEHFIPQNNDNHSESIPRNFFGTKF